MKGYLLIDHEMQMSEIEADSNGLPVGIVQLGAQKHAFPLVEEARVQVELPVGQLEPVVRLALADGEQSVRQGRSEAEAQVVALVARRLDGHVRRAVERHGRRVLAELTVEPERALAGELVLGLVLQEGHADAAVETRDVDAAQQLDGAVLAAVVLGAAALVVGHLVDAAGAVLAGLEAAALVDLELAVVALVAVAAQAGVVVDAVDARAELAGRLGEEALVDVHLAVGSLEAGETAAQVAAGGVERERLVREDGAGQVEGRVRALEARGGVLAGLRLALVHVHLAVLALVARVAVALVVLDQVHAVGAVQAGGALAVVDVDLAVLALEAGVAAVALVRVHTVDAETVVLARG